MRTLIFFALLCIAAAYPASAPTTLATDDLLDITVIGASQPEEPTIFHERVDPTGQINLPLVGTIKVKGLSPQQAANSINAAFRAKQILKDAKALVKVVETQPNVSIHSAPVAAQDRVRIAIWDLSAPGMQDVITRVVERDGTVDLPLIGKQVIVGQTETQVEQTVANAYRDKQLLANPMIECLRVGAPRAKPGR